MKKSYFVIISFLLFLFITGINSKINTQVPVEINTDTIVTDYDGNIYHTVTIGTQVWLKENLKSLHYSDGETITGVMAYNNSDSLANIYGRLYTWNAAMRNSTQQGVQGACPVGYHIPADSEWIVLSNYLGGNSIAGGKLKETDTVHWSPPNTGASNTTGFTAPGGGEWENGNFQYIKMYGLFWSSTQASQTQAKYWYLQYNSGSFTPYTWNKILAYSVRCIKDALPVSVEGNSNIVSSYELKQNYPNPFNPVTKIAFDLPQNAKVKLIIYDIFGREIITLVNNEFRPAGKHISEFDGSSLASGVYFYSLQVEGGKTFTAVKKMVLIK
jgi:uncharacterized protein (TIGR02145 family)